jgi:hypothetical protein
LPNRTSPDRASGSPHGDGRDITLPMGSDWPHVRLLVEMVLAKAVRDDVRAQR